ncbi:GIY-YIG nuclease family protein [Methylacidimicrobium cyclopophantes]|uniref:GIY-YIG nuclease family protein n=1 Tax=Methylacidimicrobium cyclopophantes TaxID=1041766 RepID=UPI001FE2FE56|nr:GIY-YIG nuclease family protein [Methylacidimicrobium cyclopophantes]
MAAASFSVGLSAEGEIAGRQELPREPGSYLLVFALLRKKTLSIGRLGVFPFSQGIYVYCGSALGPGGIRGRVNRHLRRIRLWWHIDYLLQHSDPIGLVFTRSPRSLECDWSRRLGKEPGSSFPVPGFGASDCRRGCPAHLLFLAPAPSRMALPGTSAEILGEKRTCGLRWQQLKEAILLILETAPHGVETD